MSKLQKECAKYLNSEGIYYRKTKSGILACINGQFVMFEFGEKTPVRKLKASGGLCYRPCSLSNFIGMVRTIQDMTNGREVQSQ